MRRSTVFAPATVANVAVGFDILGLSFPVVGDTVTVSVAAEGCPPTVQLTEVEGMPGLTMDPKQNTATVALEAMLHELDLGMDLQVQIRKGIPMSSGMVGSAASAVGAVVALDDLLGKTCRREQLLRYALVGEAAASGGMHPDNVAPCLFGGIVTCVMGDHSVGEQPTVVPLPAPPGIECVLAHPHTEIETRAARASLQPQVALTEHVAQSACLAGFVTALHTGDLDLLQLCMQDLIIGPQRAPSIPGLDDAMQAAREAGALGGSISGSGPSVFAWARRQDAAAVESALVAALQQAGHQVDAWTCTVGAQGAKVIAR